MTSQLICDYCHRVILNTPSQYHRLTVRDGMGSEVLAWDMHGLCWSQCVSKRMSVIPLMHEVTSDSAA